MDISVITIERTYDSELVQAIIGDEELHKRAGDYVAVEMYRPDEQKDIYYLVCERDEDIVGLVIFHMFNHPICYQGHLNYLPEFWGTGLEEVTKKAIEWMFENTECLKITSFAPDFYPEVLKHAIKSGLHVEGYLEKSIMINNLLDNQTIVGIEK